MAVKKSSAPADTVRKTAAPKKPRKAASATPPLSDAGTPVAADEIARRAYELFLEQGAEHGRDLEHWLTAERELGQTSATS